MVPEGESEAMPRKKGANASQLAKFRKALREHYFREAFEVAAKYGYR